LNKKKRKKKEKKKRKKIKRKRSEKKKRWNQTTNVKMLMPSQQEMNTANRRN